MSRKQIIQAVDMCYHSPVVFINDYSSIYDAKTRDWIPFRLWPFQALAIKTIHENNLINILKARQLGMSWVALAYILWEMLFRPGSSILIASRREEESKYLLSDERLKGMFNHLPSFLTQGVDVISDSKLKFSLSNGSVARAIPSNRGDSYTGQIVFADEFDLVQDQEKLLLAVQPVVSAGGKLILVSKANKNLPLSSFKRIYRSGKEPGSPWTSLFFPWYSRPDRTQEWYDRQVQDSLARTKTMDAVYENYPASDEEALQPYQQNKRFPDTLLRPCYFPSANILNHTVFVPDIQVFREPESGHEYVIGVDPAEGNPTSDFSAVSVFDKTSMEEVALYRQRVQIDNLAEIVENISLSYNMAPVLVERNNHGHALILDLRKRKLVKLLSGPDKKTGMLTSRQNKALYLTVLATALSDGTIAILSDEVFSELGSLTGDKLSAPDGLHDDAAIAFALAVYAVLGKRTAKPRIYYTRSL